MLFIKLGVIVILFCLSLHNDMNCNFFYFKLAMLLLLAGPVCVYCGGYYLSQSICIVSQFIFMKTQSCSSPVCEMILTNGCNNGYECLTKLVNYTLYSLLSTLLQHTQHKIATNTALNNKQNTLVPFGVPIWHAKFDTLPHKPARAE